MFHDDRSTFAKVALHFHEVRAGSMETKVRYTHTHCMSLEIEMGSESYTNWHNNIIKNVAQSCFWCIWTFPSHLQHHFFIDRKLKSKQMQFDDNNGSKTFHLAHYDQIQIGFHNAIFNKIECVCFVHFDKLKNISDYIGAGHQTWWFYSMHFLSLFYLYGCCFSYVVCHENRPFEPLISAIKNKKPHTLANRTTFTKMKLVIGMYPLFLCDQCAKCYDSISHSI